MTDRLPNAPEILMTPGPTPVPAEVLLAQAAPLLYHRGPGYGGLLREVTQGLQWLLNTTNDIYVYSSSGTGAMEGAVANVVSPGDRVLVVSVGYFGERWAEMCKRFGCRVQMYDCEWGKVARPEEVARILDDNPDIQIVFTQHSETSTGVVNDLERIAHEVKSRDRLLVVDAISSAGALDLQVDKWGIDVCIGGSQKALGATPGVSFVAISDAGWAAHQQSSAPRFYFDWTAYKDAYERADPESPWTPAISVIAGLAASLRSARQEGKEAILERHVRLGQATKAGVQALGLSLYMEFPERGHVVTTIRLPEGISGKKLVGHIRKRFGIVIAGGQGPLSETVFRIGHLGFVEPLDVLRVLAALEIVLGELGYPVKLGAAVAAAQQVFSQT